MEDEKNGACSTDETDKIFKREVIRNTRYATMH
jgi:hypothetical protein